MKLLKLTSFIILALSMSLSGCNGNTGPFQEEFVSYDIVCFDNQSNNSGATFSLYKPDADVKIEYHDPISRLDTALVKPGDRLLLGYVPEGLPYESGRVRITGYSTISNDALRVSENGVEQEMPHWRSNGIYLYSMWRTGPYLNVHGRLVYSENERTLSLVIDRHDVVDEKALPVLRLIYQSMEHLDNFEREFYASFDISALWDKDWVDGIEVRLNNTNLKQDSFIFKK